jgi:hypothetical protein
MRPLTLPQSFFKYDLQQFTFLNRHNVVVHVERIGHGFPRNR